MSYTPAKDFLALVRNTADGAQIARIPGLDYVVDALARAKLIKLWTSQTAPTANFASTAWFKPAMPSWTAEGVLYLWNPATSAYETATPKLWSLLISQSAATTDASLLTTGTLDPARLPKFEGGDVESPDAGSAVLNLKPNGVTPGTFVNVDVDDTGRVTGGSSTLARAQMPVMVGTDGIVPGQRGAVPAPAITKQFAFLRGDGNFMMPGVDITNFGANGNNVFDNLTAFNDAISFVMGTMSGRGLIYVPPGRFAVSNTIITPNGSKIVIDGAHKSASIIRQTNPAADGVYFACDEGDYLTTGGGVSNITIEAGAGYECSGFFGQGSTGSAFKAVRRNDGFFSRNIGFHNFGAAYNLQGCWNTYHSNFITLFNQRHVYLTRSPGGVVAGGNKFYGGKCSNNGYAGNNLYTTGILIDDSGGEFFNAIDVTALYRGVQLSPQAGRQVAYLWFTDVLADTSDDHGWYIDGSLGYVVALLCKGCWSSFNKGNGVFITGNGVRGVGWTNGAIRQNDQNGVSYSGGGDGILFDGVNVGNNSFTTANTYSGFSIANGAGNIQIVNCYGPQDGGGTSSQKYFINLGSGGDHIVINGNNAHRAFSTAALSNANSSTNLIIKNNVPVSMNV